MIIPTPESPPSENRGKLFVQACEAQHLPLTPHTIRTLIDRDADYTGGRGVSQVLMYQNRNHDKYPFDFHEPLTLDRLPDERPLRMLGALANALHEGVPRTSPSDRTPPTTRWLNICGEAEGFWRETYEGMNDPRKHRINMQVFIEDDKPVLLRKGLGNATGLLLEDMQIGMCGVKVPSGCIVQVETSDDRKLLDRSQLVIPRKSALVTPFARVTGLAFARLTPMALPPAQREAYFDSIHGVTPEVLPTIEQVHSAAAALVAERSGYSWRALTRRLFA